LDLKIIHCPHVSLSQIFGRPGKDPVVLKDKKAHAKELDEQTLPLAEHKNRICVQGDGFDYNNRRTGDQDLEEEANGSHLLDALQTHCPNFEFCNTQREYLMWENLSWIKDWTA